MRNVGAKFWTEVLMATVSGLLTLLTLVWHDWIEMTGWDPDQHSGIVEWVVVGLLAAVTLLAAVLARIEWRRTLPAT
jgi:hypothetical protein